MRDNPFAAPESELVAPRPLGAARGQWRRGKILHHPIGAEFADRCVKCNGPPSGVRLRRKLYWHTPWLFVLVIQIWVYVLVALIVRKKAVVDFVLCAEHAARRRRFITFGVLGVVLGLVLFIGALMGTSANGAWVAISMVLFIVGIVVLIVGERVLTPVRIDKQEAQLAGVCEAYLAELPTGQV